ncbi:MAG: response regulator [Endomicrobiia bacterium]
MNILIIDDDTEILDLLESFYTSLGHSVTVTTNSDEGLKKIATETFDLLMLDIVLPENDGITILKEVKKTDPNLPVIMVTGYREADKVIEAFRNGAMDCLLKPFNFDYIKNNVLPQVPERKK